VWCASRPKTLRALDSRLGRPLSVYLPSRSNPQFLSYCGGKTTCTYSAVCLEQHRHLWEELIQLPGNQKTHYPTLPSSLSAFPAVLSPPRWIRLPGISAEVIAQWDLLLSGALPTCFRSSLLRGWGFSPTFLRGDGYISGTLGFVKGLRLHQLRPLAAVDRLRPLPALRLLFSEIRRDLADGSIGFGHDFSLSTYVPEPFRVIVVLSEKVRSSWNP